MGENRMSDQMAKTKPNNEAHNTYVLGWLFAVSLACAVLRSVGTFDAPLHWQNPSDSTLVISLVIAIGMPTLWIIQSPGRASYFLGASPALGIFPSLPHVPFLHEFTHLLLITAAVAYWRGRQHRLMPATLTTPVLLYVVFAVLSIASVLFNYSMHQSIWQFKVGISGLIVVVAFAWLLLELAGSEPNERAPFEDILKGFLHASIGAAIIGVVAIILLFVTPYSTGSNGLGNNTIYGLGYFDRMQLLFEGPSFAGMYFVIAIGLAIYAINRNIGRNSRLLTIFLQISPWLVMASGSRAARICLVLILLTGLLVTALRRTTLLVLPSAAIAFLVAVDFQSLPSATMYSLAKAYPDSGLSASELSPLSLDERFFQDNERIMLLKNSIAFFFSSSPLAQWIGNGFGVAGNRASPFPGPHQQPLDLLIEVGVLGFVTYCLFMLSCLVVLMRTKAADESVKRPLHYMLAASLGSMALFSLTYETGTRGIGMVMITLILASSASSRSSELRHG